MLPESCMIYTATHARTQTLSYISLVSYLSKFNCVYSLQMNRVSSLSVPALHMTGASPSLTEAAANKQTSTQK